MKYFNISRKVVIQTTIISDMLLDFVFPEYKL